MPDRHADALVLFGATGDLAYEQIFPALQAMTRRSHLNVPVIGVAKPDWTVEQLRARAQQSIAAHGGLDAEAFAKLATHRIDRPHQDARRSDDRRRRPPD
jgi:glucose-6-phosphate 1-dehydrogenase